MISFMIGVDDALRRTLSAASVAEACRAAVDTVLAAVDQIFSEWLPGSFLSEMSEAVPFRVLAVARAVVGGDGASLVAAVLDLLQQDWMNHVVDALLTGGRPSAEEIAPSLEQDPNVVQSTDTARPELAFLGEPPLESQVLADPWIAAFFLGRLLRAGWTCRHDFSRAAEKKFARRARFPRPVRRFP